VRCAERHGYAITPSDVPLQWDWADGAAVATTQLGQYLVELTGEPTGFGIAPGRSTGETNENGRPGTVSALRLRLWMGSITVWTLFLAPSCCETVPM